jgi:hypothetical protein
VNVLSVIPSFSNASALIALSIATSFYDITSNTRTTMAPGSRRILLDWFIGSISYAGHGATELVSDRWWYNHFF